MPNTNPSANMNLPLPVVGVDPGPDYGNDNNSCFTILDAHSHVPGSGVQITPDAMNISSDLSFGSNNATLLRSTRFDPQVSVLVGASDLGCLSVVGVDLYFNDGSGNQIRITQSGGIVGSPGSISGLVSPASATYVGGSATFVWQSAANTAANMDGGSVILRNITASSFGITLTPPTLAADYTITLPPLSGYTSFLRMSSAGTMSTGVEVDNTSMYVSGSNLSVKPLGITTGLLADSAVSTAKIGALQVVSGNLGAQSVLQDKMGPRPIASTVAAGGFALSSTTGTVTITSATFVSLATVVITTTGRPTKLCVMPDGTGSPYSVSLEVGAILYTRILRNGTPIRLFEMNLSTAGVVDNITLAPSFECYDVAGAGTYTYVLQMALDSPGPNAAIAEGVLVAYET